MKTTVLLFALLWSSISFSQLNGSNLGLLISAEYGNENQQFVGLGAWYQKERIHFGARVELLDIGCIEKIEPKRIQFDLRYLFGSNEQKFRPFIGASFEYFKKRKTIIQVEYVRFKRPNGYCYPDGKNYDEYLLEVDEHQKTTNVNFAVTPGFRYQLSPFLFLSVAAKLGMNQYGYKYSRLFYHEGRPHHQTNNYSRDRFFCGGEVQLEFCLVKKRTESVSKY